MLRQRHPLLSTAAIPLGEQHVDLMLPMARGTRWWMIMSGQLQGIVDQLSTGGYRVAAAAQRINRPGLLPRRSV
jgi:hypothetical protein